MIQCEYTHTHTHSEMITTVILVNTSIILHSYHFVCLESEEYIMSLLIKVKEDSEKAGLTLSIQKTKITASSLITSQQIDGEIMETVKDFIFLGSRITADGDCSQEIKRHLLLGRKAMTNLDSMLKTDITLLTMV